MQIKKLIIICSIIQLHTLLQAVITSPSTPTTTIETTSTAPSTTTTVTPSKPLQTNPTASTNSTAPAVTPSTPTTAPAVIPSTPTTATSPAPTTTTNTTPSTSTVPITTPVAATSSPDIAPTPLSAPTFTTAAASTSTTNTPTSSTTTSPSPTNTATESQTTTATVPKAPIKKEQFLTSIYIQNNFKNDAILNQIDLLVSNKETPIVKANLNIKVPALKSLYAKGSVIGFDITTSQDITSFNGVASITIDTDKISMTNIKTGYGVEHPIKITQKDGHWILDEA